VVAADREESTCMASVILGGAAAVGADPRAGMVRIPGGTFVMGSDRHYPEEAPALAVQVDAFLLDRTTVTNADFAAFVDATGYRTVAERPLDPARYSGARPELLEPGSLVFRMSEGPVDLADYRNWWHWTPGACWKHPEGPHSAILGRLDHPVVHVAYADVKAYARWAGKDLPTEAEWEFAARGGLEAAEFAWGDALLPGGKYLANFWQGAFPFRNDVLDGFSGTAPVASYPANAYGLHDMIGNVWEWTSDWFATRHQAPAPSPCCVPENPRGAAIEGSFDPAQPAIRIPRKVLKGGSFLCAENYCRRYRPAARHAQMVDSGMSHVGFRCVLRD
jgi:formylglycine-generating enzyme required for sulfatase activity